jgi:hypothetical protein
MKMPVVLVALASVVLFLTVPARAVTEACPARLAAEAVSSTAENSRGPATLFGFELSAYGPRTLSATLEFDTNRGWFSLDVPAVTLTENDRHYSVGFAHDTMRDWVSPVMYARFPSPVQLRHSWIFSAAATGDGPFGWEKLGRVACTPPPPSMESADSVRTISYATTVRTRGARPTPSVILDPADEDKMSQTPDPAARVFLAAASRAIGKSDCDKPFVEASPEQMVAPGFPAAMIGSPFPGIVGIRIALNANGSLADAWVWASSGHQAYDDVALSAIRQSTYSGAVAYCAPVPSQYNAFIIFDPS